MQTEIEAAVLAADHDELRSKLEQAGATLVQPRRLMRRANYDFLDGRLQKIGGWVRVRNEGDKITMTYKQLNARTVEGMKEANLVINDMDQADAFLRALGLEQKSYQETRRESWRLGNAEVELDEWPWIAPFIEIEAPSEESLKDAFGQLHLNWQQAVFGSVEAAYQAEYDVSEELIDALPRITFDMPVPEALTSRKRSQS